MYGSDRHGDPIVGNAMIVRAGDERLMLLTKDEAEMLSTGLDALRDMSIEKISKAFGLQPIPTAEREIMDATRRQSCRKVGMER